jgi:CheY-like chemotaxis protein
MEGKPRILGVDDSLTIRKALEIVLKPAGYELELAVDGAEALAKAKSFRPALILLDFILPDMRGSEVCQHLALDPETAQIPVILVSAKGAEIRQAYRDARNVVSYIAKPFKPQVVTSIVAEVLAKTAAGELVKSTVPVHEAEGISLPLLAESAPQAPPAVTPAQAPSFSIETPLVSAEPAPAAYQASAAVSDAAAAVPREELEDVDAEESVDFPALAPAFAEPVRREALDLMFETLRASIEGVYVEEVDTPLGAAADQAKSYTDLLDSLTRELGEGLRHARSGARFLMYGDGSVRSLDESLLEMFRRSCRLLFRAVTAGAVSNESAPVKRRFLVACQKDSQVARQIPAMLAAHPDWQVFTVSEGFRQLPMMVRLYGATDLITEVTWHGALWDQLRTLTRLPEAREMRVIGVLSADRQAPSSLSESDRLQALQERGIQRTVESVFDVDREIERGDDETEALAGAPSGEPATDLAVGM